ncbi:MAG: SWIM zinc finger family protein, partial [Planctomycetaceae bacterium]|nr:SWIM zinc finger family protein [Planctomycetaceae bacterium]
NNWRAKYRGNYGVYTIKITTDGKKTIKFSCSCPSDYYPCKHIAMIEDAIAEHIAKNKNRAEKEIKCGTNSIVAKLLRKVSQKELYEFIVRQAHDSKKLTNTILIEFADKVTKKSNSNSSNPYSIILRKALHNTKVREEEYYCRYENETGIEIEAFDRILIRLKEYFDQKNYREVVFICKACIEELAGWLVKKRRKFDDINEFISYEYIEVPFRILGDVVNIAESKISGVDLKELYDYCRSEIKNSKYVEAGLFTEFNDLFLKISLKVNPDGFIEFQDELLNNIRDKSSYEAARIFERKISLYELSNQTQKAWKIIEENVQIDSFCKKLAEKKIEEKKYTEAKKLINDYLNNDNPNRRISIREWNKLLLKIAQKEKDTPTIQKISFAFIKGGFEAEYFKIYKSTFTNEDWKEVFEQLLINYENTGKQNSSYFNNSKNSVYDLLVAENEIERLLEFVEKHLTVHLIERYYKNFADEFPAQTLLLFRKALDNYIKDTLGRDAYEYLAEMLKKMQKIDGGNKIVSDMVNQYQILYKKRKAMCEILSKF